MKVAFLTPAVWNVESPGKIFSPDIISEVIGAFGSLGWDVENVPSEIRVSGNSQSEYMGMSLRALENLSAFFGKAQDYALIYNFCGMAPLLLSGITDTPVLTVLDRQGYMQAGRFYDDHVSTCHFVWIEDTGINDIPLSGFVINIAQTVANDRNMKVAEGLFTAGKDLLKRLRKEDHRPWGYYVVLSDLDDHKVKRIIVYPGKRLSLQSHKRRSEHWMVVSGKGVVTLDADQLELGPGQSVDIPVGTKHRMTNKGDAPVVFVEVQTGDYFGEDDIERYEDDFGRV